MPRLGPVEILVLAAGLAMAVLLVVGIVRAAHPDAASQWAARHGVELSERTRPLVIEYLTRSRRFRLGGALIGLVAPLGTDVPGFELLMGYLLGALVAELTRTRLTTGSGARAASLSPRVLGDYVPGYVPVVLRSVTVSAAVLLPLYLWGPERWAPGVKMDEAAAVGGGVAAIALPLVVELLLRRMVARPQPAASPDLIAVDDAIRAASVHAAAGAGVGACLLLLGALSLAVGVTSDVQVLRWVLPLLGTGLFLSGVSFWLRLGPGTPWKVRRSGTAAGVGV
jgi:hypothetical protein